jgi:hypothetical protein
VFIATSGVYAILGGGACLYLSDVNVYRSAWTQATYEAFGVGLVIGGFVDCLVIALLSDKFTKSTLLIYVTGGLMLAGGGVCLYLSWAAHTGSWAQGTFDAFGVGFLIAGFLDVLTIQGWNRLAAKRVADRDRYVGSLEDS